MYIPPLPTQEDCQRSLRLLARTQPAQGEISDEKIIVALSQHARQPDDYFMTTRLFWECECVPNYDHVDEGLRFRLGIKGFASGYYHTREDAYCPQCDLHSRDCSDARINELAYDLVESRTYLHGPNPDASVHELTQRGLLLPFRTAPSGIRLNWNNRELIDSLDEYNLKGLSRQIASSIGR